MVNKEVLTDEQRAALRGGDRREGDQRKEGQPRRDGDQPKEGGRTGDQKPEASRE